jgi:carboxylesterase
LGALVVHGFTGTPFSMLPIGRALAAAGFDVELPRLPGHATDMADMLTTGWADWYGEVERAYRRLAERVAQVVVIGQSMGGTLVLTTALDHPVAGVVAINPLTRDRPAEVHEYLDDLLGDGFAVIPGGPSDIADPDAHDPSYVDSPVGPLASLLVDGARPLESRLAEGRVPLRLFTSRHDHVVEPADSEFLASVWSGPVEHTWLERGYHGATLDFDRDLVTSGTVEFVTRLAAAARAA